TFATVYAMHFLTEARAQGFSVPNDLFYNGISYLKELAGQNVSDIDKARIQAYAIYLLTRNEIVTTNYLTNLQLYLQKDVSNAWQKDITAVYMAASYQLLKSNEDASKLISHYNPQSGESPNSDFFDRNTSNAQYLYIIAKHFPERLATLGDKLLVQLVSTLNSDEINTLLSGYTSLALGAYPQNDGVNNGKISITTLPEGLSTSLADNTNYQKVALDQSVKQVRFNNPDQTLFFYQLMQSGFDKSIAKEPIKKEMEIYREYRNADGSVATQTSLGNEIEVHIQIRALNDHYFSNIAIEDLLPGGFEVVRDSVKTDTWDFADIREDRVNFFGSVDSTTREIVYKIKAINPGTYTVPPAYAEAMYNPAVQARGVASSITVN
ncbi:MAG: alpha-2-macroglobulin, partial [Legionella sp.]|nr:alpha-2-macroglobulin [Legionella sp.]